MSPSSGCYNSLTLTYSIKRRLEFDETVMPGETDHEPIAAQWKVEMKERRMRKPEEFEVPQWKHDLLKRIRTKNQRMIEEKQQSDVLEEHIPRVSNNIFLVQGKQHGRIAPPAAQKMVTPRLNPTPQPSMPILSVDNVIIIEKETQDMVEEATASRKLDSGVNSSDENKEFPTAGIVHRLMGKFEEDKAVCKGPAKVDAASRVDLGCQSVAGDISTQDCESNDSQQTGQSSITAPTTQQSTSVKEELSIVYPCSYTTPSALLSPLLRSSAKPYSKQSMSLYHKYHHVSRPIPIRKVSTPSPKHITTTSHSDGLDVCIGKLSVNSAAKDEATLSKTSQQLVTSKVSIVQLPQELMASKSPVTDISCNSHGTQVPFVPSKETIIFEKEDIKDLKSRREVDLEKGEILHSIRNHTRQLDLKISESSIDKARLVFELDAAPSSFPLEDTGSSDSKNDINKISVATENMNSDAEVDAFSHKPKGVNVMGRNGANISIREYNVPCLENEFTQIVHESSDKSTLKGQAVRAANHVMQNSKTLKITPSMLKQSSEVPSAFLSQPEKPAYMSSPFMQQPKPTLYLNQTKTQLTMSEVAILDEKNRIICREQTENAQSELLDNLPSTYPDAVLDGPESKSEDVALLQQISKPPNSLLNRTNLCTVLDTPKSGFSQKCSSYPLEKRTACRAKSFVIDPSKFRKSSAQPPIASKASTSFQEFKNTQVIVPAARSTNLTNSDHIDEHSKKGRRKLGVDEITVIGGYVTLEKSCLVKDTKAKKNVSLSFSEKELETTYTYTSERSLLQCNPAVKSKESAAISLGFRKDSTIGKYTPKYLLSMKDADILGEDESVATCETKSTSPLQDLAPFVDDNAVAWSRATSSCMDILF